MSSDSYYLLSYDIQSYTEPTPQKKDIRFLEENYGGKCERVTEYLTYWEKPKYCLLPEVIERLYAEQVIERINADIWKIVKGLK